MVNTFPASLCTYPGASGCSRHPSFRTPGGTLTRCAEHKEPGMVAAGRRCDDASLPGGCDTHPSFGMPGGKPNRCVSHKEPDMVRLVGGMCQQPGGCDTHPTFGMPGGKAVRCAAHKAPDMVATYGMKRDTPAKKKRRRDPEPSIPLLDATAEEFNVHSIGDVKIAATWPKPS